MCLIPAECSAAHADGLARQLDQGQEAQGVVKHVPRTSGLTAVQIVDQVADPYALEHAAVQVILPWAFWWNRHGSAGCQGSC